MAEHEIESICEDGLAEVSRYLSHWIAREDPGAWQALGGQRADEALRRRLDWRLCRNPARDPALELGYSIRGRQGELAGVLLVFPARFCMGDRKLTGLCSGSFFVERPARLAAFFAFRRYLNLPGFDFWFANTCNQNSGPLWSKLGGQPVPDSQFEYLLPLRPGPVLQAFAESRPRWRRASGMAYLAGRLATPVLKPRPVRSGFAVQPCQDWERLADLARLHRNPQALSADRSARLLQWRYQQCPAPGRIQVCRFQDSRGSEGWFAWGESLRGRRRTVRCITLLDLVWPREGMDARNPLLAALEFACQTPNDLLAVPGRAALASQLAGVGLRRRGLEGPRSFVLTKNGLGEELATLADLVAADGDAE